MAKDLTVILEDRPGTLASAGEALGKANVNIDGIAGVEAGGRGILHVLVEDAGAARAALESAGLSVENERDVLVVEAGNQPGSMGQIARKIADAGVNVDLMYAATDTRLVIGANDLEKAKSAVG